MQGGKVCKKMMTTTANIRTREQAIEVLKAHSTIIWGEFAKTRYTNKAAFAEQCIATAMTSKCQKLNGDIDAYGLFIKAKSEYNTFEYESPIQADDKETDRLRSKYNGTAFMKMV